MIPGRKRSPCMAFFSAKWKPLSVSPPWQAEPTVSQSTSYCSLKGDKWRVTMNQALGRPNSQCRSRAAACFDTSATRSLMRIPHKHPPDHSPKSRLSDKSPYSNVSGSLRTSARALQAVNCGLDDTCRIVGPFGTLLCNMRPALRGGTASPTSTAAFFVAALILWQATHADLRAPLVSLVPWGSDKEAVSSGMPARGLESSPSSPVGSWVAALLSCSKLSEDGLPLTHSPRREVASGSVARGVPTPRLLGVSKQWRCFRSRTLRLRLSHLAER